MGVERWSCDPNCLQYTALCVFSLMNLPDQRENTSADISNGSGFFTSGSETWTQHPELHSPTQTRPREHPGVQQTRAYRRALDDSGDIHERVLRVLQKIEDEQLNLTIFLWALSWNNEHLKSNMKPVHERTTLMHSEELAGILASLHVHTVPVFEQGRLRKS